MDQAASTEEAMKCPSDFDLGVEPTQQRSVSIHCVSLLIDLPNMHIDNKKLDNVTCHTIKVKYACSFSAVV
jgi:hypothetical protein